MGDNDRDRTIATIRAALKRRSGKAWSVTGGRGTAWGWITIEAPPARRTWGCYLPEGMSDRPEHYRDRDNGKPGGSMSPDDRAELGRLLGLGRASYQDGESIPASGAYYREYIDRAEGRAPSALGTQYWD